MESSNKYELTESNVISIFEKEYDEKYDPEIHQ